MWISIETKEFKYLRKLSFGRPVFKQLNYKILIHFNYIIGHVSVLYLQDKCFPLALTDKQQVHWTANFTYGMLLS